jgi:hypothetical protein
MEFQKIMDDKVCWSTTHIQTCGHFIHCYAAISITMASTATTASNVSTRCAWPGRGEFVTELTPCMNFLVHSYTCCSDRHASPYWAFFLRWISMGFTLSAFKKKGWCMLQAGPPSLPYYCTVALHSGIILPPVSHSPNHKYRCCKLTRQSSFV